MKKRHGLYAKSASETSVITDINTTPLIDVMLVLLIMFIITIPQPVHSIDLILGSDQVKTLSEPKIVKIEISENDWVSVGSELMTNQVLLTLKLQDLFSKNPEIQISILGHHRSKYKTVAEVMAVARKVGFKQIGVFDAFNNIQN